MGLRKNNILSLLEDKTLAYSDRVALGMKSSYGWKEYTYKGLGLMTRKISYHLINTLGIKKGERLAILSESKPEYGACVFASVISGLVTVPLDIKLTIYELKSILSDCEPTVMMVSKTYVKTALELQQAIPSIKHIIIVDEHSKYENLENIYELPDKSETKWVHRSPKSTALIIYTSGTTGNPKGVEITFGNMLAQLEDLSWVVDKILDPSRSYNMLSILPMNHLFEMTVGFSTFLNLGFSVYYTQSLKPKDILGLMQEKQVEFMIVVPAFLKLLKAGIENELEKAPKAAKVIFKIIYNLAAFMPTCMKKKVFKKIHDKFGGHFMGCITGGAPLDVEVGKFFERIGIKVYQGYGLSETSPVVSVNYDKRDVLASVGRPLPHFESRVDAETGELQLKGPSVMKGYHNQPEITAETIDEDGWLHTGDIARIDKDGHIFITGRIKNMIVLNGGKKVFPEEVEAIIEKSEYLAEVCVLGMHREGGSKDGTEEIVAVVVPKDKFIGQEGIEKLIKDDIKVLCQQLTLYKRPNEIIIKNEALPKTTTRKVKRREVKELIKA